MKTEHTEHVSKSFQLKTNKPNKYFDVLILFVLFGFFFSIYSVFSFVHKNDIVHKNFIYIYLEKHLSLKISIDYSVTALAYSIYILYFISSRTPLFYTRSSAILTLSQAGFFGFLKGGGLLLARFLENLLLNQQFSPKMYETWHK